MLSVIDVMTVDKTARGNLLGQERLGFVIVATGLGTWEWNLRTNETIFNERWAGMLGYTLSELEPYSLETWVALTHPDDLENATSLLAPCIAGAALEYTCELRMKHKEGHWVWVLDRGRVMTWDDDGKPLLMFGTHDDISERKAAEAALIDREKFLRTALETTPDGFFVFDTQGRFQMANSALCQLTGYRHDEMTALHIRDLEALENPAQTEAHIRKIMAEGSDYFETQWRRKNGTFIWVHVSAVYLGDEQKQFVCFVRDLTQRKRDEQAVARSHALLKNLAELVPGVIYQYRLFPDGRSSFPYSSPGIYDIYEVTPAEVAEDATPVFQRLHPDDIDQVREEILESARTLSLFNCEYRVILPKQGLRWRLSEARPRREADGGTLWHGIITDITERKEAEEERENLHRQLAQSQKLESVGRLAGGVAHDFNNMLNVILGHADLMLEDLRPENPLRGDVEEIHKAALRSADLTRQLLAFARKQTIAPQRLDINKTIGAMLKLLQRLIGEDIVLRWEPAERVDPICIDPVQIDQVLANLMVNARDAIGHTTGSIFIETAMAELDETFCADSEGLAPGRFVMLSVRDDGCGMDEATQAQIFDPFFSTKGIGEGTGLGLATIYGIVKQNQGFIDVTSRPQQGATFRIYLPVDDSEGVEDSAITAPVEPAAPGWERILLVEDEPAILALGTRMLQRLGYTVLAAPTPREAIQLAEDCEGEIQLLVTDVIMPGMNGLDLAQIILALYPAAKCLYISGYTADIIAHHGVLHEGVGLIQKPFTGNALGKKVREILDGPRGRDTTG